MQAGILEQIASANFARDNLMADMFGSNDQNDRHHREDGVDIKLRHLKMRQGEEARAAHTGKVHKAKNSRQHIACHNGDQDRDDSEELAEQDGAEHRNGKRGNKDSCAAGIDGSAVCRKKAGRVGGRTGKLQAYERHNRTHGGRRQHHVDPAGTEEVDDHGKDAAEDAHNHKPALRISKGFHVLRRLLRRRV